MHIQHSPECLPTGTELSMPIEDDKVPVETAEPEDSAVQSAVTAASVDIVTGTRTSPHIERPRTDRLPTTPEY